MTPRPRSNLTCPVLPVVWQTVTYVGVLFRFGNVANDNWKCINKPSRGYSHNRENGNYRLGTNYCNSAQWTCDLCSLLAHCFGNSDQLCDHSQSAAIFKLTLVCRNSNNMESVCYRSVAVIKSAEMTNLSPSTFTEIHINQLLQPEM